MEASGGAVTSLLYHHIGLTKYDFKLTKFLDIPETTNIIPYNNTFLLSTKNGTIVQYKPATQERAILIDLKDKKTFLFRGLEEGLLGLAAYNDDIFICYTAIPNEHENNETSNYAMVLIVDKLVFKPDEKVLVNTETIIRIPFETNYHHGGTLQFTKEGLLLLSTGDGGPQGDPKNKGQDTTTLQGKFISIDVQTKETKIIASGLRNVWRFSIDSMGRIWLADVGYNSSESIKLITNVDKKHNFGWSYFEGSKQMKPGKKLKEFDQPIFEYPTSNEEGRAVLGGYFIGSMNAYIFADFLGYIKALSYNPKKDIWEQTAFQKIDEKIYSLGIDGDNLFILGEKSVYRCYIMEILKTESK